VCVLFPLLSKTKGKEEKAYWGCTAYSCGLHFFTPCASLKAEYVDIAFLLLIN
jgi:hypothetical protein